MNSPWTTWILKSPNISSKISMALLTFSMTIFFYFSVFKSKFVTVLALISTFIDRTRSVATKSVYSSCYNIQVIWIYTKSIFAQMVNSKTLWYFTSQKFPRIAMGEVILSTNHKLTISSAWSFSKVPTRFCFNDLFPKIFFCVCSHFRTLSHQKIEVK